MDTTLNNSEQTFELIAGGVLVMRQGSPLSAAVCALQSSEGPVAFTTAALLSAAPIQVGPFAVNVKLMVAALGKVGVQTSIVPSSGLGGSVNVVDALTSTDSTQALAASQGPIISALIGAAVALAGGKLDATALASQAEAIAGSSNVKWMTPLRVAQAIIAQGAGLLSAGQGALGTVLPFDTAGAGKSFDPLQLTAARTFTLGAGPIEEALLTFCLLGDGDPTHVPTFPGSFVQSGGVYDATLNQQNLYMGWFRFGFANLHRRSGALIPAPPNAPTALNVLSSDGVTVLLNWTAPATGGIPTDYIIEYKAASSGTWLLFADPISTAVTWTITGLVRGTPYNFRVSSANAAGTSAPSTVLNFTTPDVLGAPVSFAAGTPAGTSMPLTWTAPGGSPAPTDYLIEYRTTAGPGAWNTFAHTASNATARTVTGLVAGTSYDFRGSTVNGAGIGLPCTPITATTVALPGVPTALTLGTVSNSTQALSWTAPAAGGAPTDYLVEMRTTVGPGAWTPFAHTASTTPSIVVTGLTPATSYDYRVSTVNSAGTSSPTSTVTGSTTSAGSLSVSSGSPVAEDVTAAGYDDYVLERAEGNWTRVVKATTPGGTTPVGLITGPTFYGSATQGNGATAAASGSNMPNLAWTDGVDLSAAPSSSNYVALGGVPQKMEDDGTFSFPAGVRYTVPAGVGTHHVKFLVGEYCNVAPTGANGLRIKAFLSDGSAAPINIDVPAVAFSFLFVEHTFTFSAASAGQTLTIEIEETGTSDGSSGVQLVWQAVLYKAS